jgi:RND family efflux transporter MFP subunit
LAGACGKGEETASADSASAKAGDKEKGSGKKQSGKKPGKASEAGEAGGRTGSGRDEERARADVGQQGGEEGGEGGEEEREGEAQAAGQEGEGTSARRQPRERPAAVTAARVVRSELVVPVVAEGTLRARRRVDVRAEAPGRIERLVAEEGQRVAKGATLVVLDGREYRIAREEARSRYLNALGRIAVEEDSLRSGRGGDLLEQQLAELEQRELRGEITREERRAREIELGVQAIREGGYRRELIEARSGLAQARADEERAQLNLERTVIRAPFAGIVANLTLTEGHHLTVGETICTLVDNVALEAEVGVLESDLGGLETGRPALLVVPAAAETLHARVDVISPSIDPASRTCRVLLRVRNEAGVLEPGMFVRAHIAGRIYRDRLLVPAEAILTRDGRPLLFKVEDGQAKWVYVQLGLRNDQFVEVEGVLQGGPLDEGALVVVSDHLTLAHDAKVEVKRVVEAQMAWAEPAATP